MLSRTTRLVLIVSSAALAVLLAISVLFGQSDERDNIYKKFDIFIEVMNRIRNDYVEQVQPSMIFNGALKGMARMLDAESSYLTAEEYEEYSAEIGKRPAETGVRFIKSPANGYPIIVAIREGSPAAESGLRVGDFIRAIDDISTRELPLMMIDFHLRGEAESVARFSILRSTVQGLLSFDVPRTNLVPANVEAKTFDGVGYLSIPNFNEPILDEIQHKCEVFVNQGIDNLIIDLRGNVEGDLEEAVHAAELFISGGKVVTLKSKAENIEYDANDFSFAFNSIQLLCDESTARSAEVFALALAGREVAEVVGRDSLGIGTVQKDIRMEDGAFLRISYGTILGPGGSELNNNGIAPDVEVERTTEDDDTTDRILNTALERAKQKNQQKAA